MPENCDGKVLSYVIARHPVYNVYDILYITYVLMIYIIY